MDDSYKSRTEWKTRRSLWDGSSCAVWSGSTLKKYLYLVYRAESVKKLKQKKRFHPRHAKRGWTVSSYIHAKRKLIVGYTIVSELMWCYMWTYRIHLKKADYVTLYYTYRKLWVPDMCQQFAGWVAHCVDPNQTPSSAAGLGLHFRNDCLSKCFG